MRLGTLILNELRHRWLNSVLSLVTALVAVGCLVAALALLREHRLATAAIITTKEEETRARLATLADDMRKITVRMGFNILILPKDQNLGDFYADDFAQKTMPEEYAMRLASSGVATINHILPSLQQRVRWSERERTVLLIGVRGELPITSGAPEATTANGASTTSAPPSKLPPSIGKTNDSKNGDSKTKKPLLPAVPKGKAMLGYELHRSLNLRPGDTFTLLGRTFSVSECRPEKGTKDDITLWINLGEAQELLNLPGRINAILALECNCAADDRLGEIRAEVARILPDTQVIEYESKALARAEARNRAEAEGVAAIAAERERRAQLEQKERFAGAVVPLALLVCGVLIGLLSWQNVRERALEIAILRTLGLGTGSILGLVLFRAAAIGLLGSVIGYGAGLMAVNAWAGTPAMAQAVGELLAPVWMITAVVAGPLLALAAAWMPALIAAQQDPADLLREG